MKYIVITGPQGSGKSLFAQMIIAASEVPAIELQAEAVTAQTHNVPAGTRLIVITANVEFDRKKLPRTTIYLKLS